MGLDRQMMADQKIRNSFNGHWGSLVIPFALGAKEPRFESEMPNLVMMCGSNVTATCQISNLTMRVRFPSSVL
jgi:hypothetical protein